MNKIFEHLDNAPDDWQYSLYLYSYDMKKSLSKVEGSLMTFAKKINCSNFTQIGKNKKHQGCGL